MIGLKVLHFKTKKMIIPLTAALLSSTVLIARLPVLLVEGLSSPSPMKFLASSSSLSSPSSLFYKNDGNDVDIDETSSSSFTKSTTDTAAAATTATTATTNTASPPFDFEERFPGREENDKFICDESVPMWREFQQSNDSGSVEDNLKHMNDIAVKFWTGYYGPDGATYFNRHIARTGYFFMNAMLGNAAFQFDQRRRRHERSSGDDKNNDGDKNILNNVMPNTESGSRLLLETFLCYEQDYEMIRKKIYKEPWDMDTTTPIPISIPFLEQQRPQQQNQKQQHRRRSHRQSNPIYVATQTRRFVKEAVGTLGRRFRATEDDKNVKFFIELEKKKKQTQTQTSRGGGGTISSTKEEELLLNKNKHNKYPDYYQTAFHYQGDGWMSTDSANVYETSTETLFLGRQDSMQRTTLPPIMEVVSLREKQNLNRRNSVLGVHHRPIDEQRAHTLLEKQRPMRVLEVACGTGRFMTFVRDNLPSDAKYTAVDLSPFYLQKAKDNDKYWRKFRRSDEDDNNDYKNNKNIINVDDDGRTKKKPTTIEPANLIHSAGEDLPFDDDSFDVVLCVYLFHELPRIVRGRVAAEISRVIAPGGTVVLTDSIQKGDRPALDNSLGNFGNMNEPYYVDYINDDIGSHFERHGLEPKTKALRSTTKSLSFTKPGQLDWSGTSHNK